MRNYADEANLHARIYALKSRLFTRGNYASIIRDRQTNPQLSFAPDTITAKEALFQEQIAPVIGLTCAYPKYTPLFRAYLQQFEARNARTLLARAAGLESEVEWYDIGQFAVLDRSLLAEKLSPAEIRSLVAGTYLDDDFKETLSYRHMEIRMDICIARNLYRSSALLPAHAQKEFRDVLQRRIALLTIIWSQRLRRNYRFREEKISLYLQKFYEIFTDGDGSPIQTAQEALNRQLEQIYKGSSQEPSLADVEHRLEQNYFAWISSIFHRDFHSLYCVVAYLWLLFYQIRNLFCIIDGRRFGFSAEALLNKLICES